MDMNVFEIQKVQDEYGCSFLQATRMWMKLCLTRIIREAKTVEDLKDPIISLIGLVD